MPLNAQFFAAIRTSKLYGGAIPQMAVDGFNDITTAFDGFTGHGNCVDDLAYIFATAYRECGTNIDITIKEVGRGAGKAYGVATGQYGQTYYGRGPCQVTWLANYQKAKVRTGIDFVQFPDKMCDRTNGPICMLDGMYGGTFTGKSLRTYITPGKVTTLDAFAQCRRIINGTDHAAEIAANAVIFQRALQTGYDKPVSTPTVRPSTPPLTQQPQRGLWSDLKRLFGGK